MFLHGKSYALRGANLGSCGRPVVREGVQGTNRGGCFFNGSLTLTDGQISDLEDNQWYVTATAFSTLRGQIVPIPEPSTVAFFGLALGLPLMLWRWRVHCERA